MNDICYKCAASLDPIQPYRIKIDDPLYGEIEVWLCEECFVQEAVKAHSRIIEERIKRGEL